MEQTIEQNQKGKSLSDHKNKREQWCKEDVLKLAQHFHCFNKEKAMYNRVTHFEMTSLKKFNEIKKDIQKMKIYLTLEKDDRDKITCVPQLEVNDNENLVFELTPVAEISKQNYFGDFLVPKIFKDFVWNNWKDIEMHLIDDLFHCLGKKYDTDLKSLVRVEYFEFDDIAKNIQSFEGDITAITLYPGIDMNKFGKKDWISFTPVLGIKPRIDNGQSRKGLFEFNNDETYAEYSRPCPPTCPKE